MAKAGLIIFGIILAVVGFVLAGDASNTIGACQSGMGRIAGFFSPSYSAQCSDASFLSVVGFGMLLVGIILFILGLALGGKARGKNRNE